MTLEEILENKTSGSSELCIEICILLRENINSPETLLNFVSTIQREMQVFTAVIKLANQVEALIKSKDTKRLKDFLDEYEFASLNRYRIIYSKAQKYVKDKTSFVTLSNSKTIEEVIKLIFNDNKSIRVTILRSLPGGEGEILFNKLRQAGISSELIEDSDAEKAVSGCDVVLAGADSILSTGNIVNKTGTMKLARLCRDYNKPFLVLAENSKRTSQGKYKHEDKMRKNFFEEVPKELITEIITE